MSHQTLKSFIDLVTFDQRLIDLSSKIKKIQDALFKNQQQQSQQQQNLVHMQSRKQDLQKIVHTQELDLKDMQEREKQLMHQMESMSAAKAYDAAIKELDHIRFDQTNLEQKLVYSVTKLQSLDKESAIQEEQVRQTLELLQKEAISLQDQIVIDNQELDLATKQRSEKTVGVPQEWIDTYELMRGRVANPVVELQQESCSVCFHGVTPRDLQMLRQNGILQCKDCYRFLYEESVA